MMAERFFKPVYCLVESFKFVRISPVDQCDPVLPHAEVRLFCFVLVLSMHRFPRSEGLATRETCVDCRCPAWLGGSFMHARLTCCAWRFTRVLLYMNATDPTSSRSGCTMHCLWGKSLPLRLLWGKSRGGDGVHTPYTRPDVTHACLFRNRQ